MFTHNIFSITDQLKLTLGARYTHERKTLNADLTDNNDSVHVYRGAIRGLQQLPCVIPAFPAAASSSTTSAARSKLSGTAVHELQADRRLLTYASYSRGYKAGGFNLDRSALFRARRRPRRHAASVRQRRDLRHRGAAGLRGHRRLGRDLQFKPEINDAFEIGAKYNGRGIDVNVAVFHQVFRDFQLNTFNGLNFIVENINSCSEDLNGADKDNSPAHRRLHRQTRARGVKQPGLRARGVHAADARPRDQRRRDVWRTRKYRDNLVGAGGKPLTNALFQLPGRRISERAEVDRHRVARLDSADRRQRACAGSSTSTPAT